jgi:NifU-like protein involved in Fe-S cluster formation
VSGYNRLVTEHFERPRNAGQWPAAPDVMRGYAGSVAQGVEFTLSARIAGSTVQAVRFQAYGCPHCIASASWLTEQLPGRTHPGLLQWQWREVAHLLEVPTQKYGRLLVLEDALRSLAADWAGRL